MLINILGFNSSHGECPLGEELRKHLTPTPPTCLRLKRPQIGKKHKTKFYNNAVGMSESFITQVWEVMLWIIGMSDI